MNQIIILILIVYLTLHLPAFILIFLGYVNRNTNPERAKTYFIAAGIYFLIGGGICGAILSGGI